jgi:hypothetical protein
MVSGCVHLPRAKFHVGSCRSSSLRRRSANEKRRKRDAPHLRLRHAESQRATKRVADRTHTSQLVRSRHHSNSRVGNTRSMQIARETRSRARRPQRPFALAALLRCSRITWDAVTVQAVCPTRSLTMSRALDRARRRSAEPPSGESTRRGRSRDKALRRKGWRCPCGHGSGRTSPFARVIVPTRLESHRQFARLRSNRLASFR